MSLTDTIIPVCAILALIGGILAWLYKRGGDEREFTVAIRDAANAVRELTGEFRGYKESTTDELHSHAIRLTKLEAIHPHGSHSPDRDSGTPAGHSEG